MDQDSKPVSLDSQNLTRLRDSSMADGVRKGLCSAINAPKACPECLDNFMGAHLFRSVLKRPFLLVDSEENGFGGVFTLVVFKAHPNVYRLWVYRLSSGEFQLREMTQYMALNKALVQELSHQDYAPYWLNACRN